MSWANAYHGECHFVQTDGRFRNCGMARALMEKCLSDEDVIKDGGLDPLTYKFNRYTKEDKEYCVWNDLDFTKRARESCTTIISMFCYPGFYQAGEFFPTPYVPGRDPAMACKLLIDAAISKGYQIMMLSGEQGIPNETYEVIETKEVLDISK